MNTDRTQSADGLESESVYALVTYYNYVRAWRVCIEKGRGKGAKDVCIREMRETPLLGHLQGGGTCTRDIESSYWRGMFTLLAMREFPVGAHPDVAPFANFWLPVQAYYAVHGVGLATLAAIGQPSPKEHSGFRSAFSVSLAKYFPYPLGMACHGGPEANDFGYSGVGLSANDVREQSNLAVPCLENAETLVGKSLCTTRERLLHDRLDQARRQKVTKGRRRRALRMGERQAITDRVPATTVCDFLYRMRVRANYDDPEMYLTSRDYADQAVSHYADLLFVTELVVECLGTLIERKIGRETFAVLRRKVEARSLS
jgi:hypothetical protein